MYAGEGRFDGEIASWSTSGVADSHAMSAKIDAGFVGVGSESYNIVHDDSHGSAIKLLPQGVQLFSLRSRFSNS